MLPLGGLLVCIFVGWYLKRSVSYEELTNGGKLKAGLFQSVYLLVEIRGTCGYHFDFYQ